MQKQVAATEGFLAWKQAGACRGLDATIFHPDPTKGQRRAKLWRYVMAALFKKNA